MAQLEGGQGLCVGRRWELGRGVGLPNLRISRLGLQAQRWVGRGPTELRGGGEGERGVCVYMCDVVR